MDLIVPQWDAPASVGALSTTRRGGASAGVFDDGGGGGGFNVGRHVGDDPAAVQANRASLARLLPSEPRWMSQVHGADVVDAAEIDAATRADASIATRPGVVCAIQTADCLPVLFADAEGRVVGAAHAGWRGLAGGVLENTVARMRDAGAGEMLAWMGPAIGPASFEVGADVLDAFVAQDGGAAEAFRPIDGTPGKYFADLYALARRRLASAGVQRIAGGGWDTFAERERFYSFRRDKVTGRMVSLIWIKQAG